MATIHPINEKSNTSKTPRNGGAAEPSLERRLHQCFSDAVLQGFETILTSSKSLLDPIFEEHPYASRQIFSVQEATKRQLHSILGGLSENFEEVIKNPGRQIRREEESGASEEDDLSLSIMDDGAVSKNLIRIAFRDKILGKHADLLHAFHARCAMVTKAMGGPIRDDLPATELLIDAVITASLQIGSDRAVQGETETVTTNGLDLRLALLQRGEPILIEAYKTACKQAALILDGVGVPPYSSKMEKELRQRGVVVGNAYVQSGTQQQTSRQAPAQPTIAPRGSSLDQVESRGESFRSQQPQHDYEPIAPSGPGAAEHPAYNQAAPESPQLSQFVPQAPHAMAGGYSPFVITPEALNNLLALRKSPGEKAGPDPQDGIELAPPNEVEAPEPPKTIQPIAIDWDVPQQDVDCGASFLYHCIPDLIRPDEAALIATARQRLGLSRKLFQFLQGDPTVSPELRDLFDGMSSYFEKVALRDPRCLLSPAHPARVLLDEAYVLFNALWASRLTPGGVMEIFVKLQGFEDPNITPNATFISPKGESMCMTLMETQAAYRKSLRFEMARMHAIKEIGPVDDPLKNFFEAHVYRLGAILLIQVGQTSHVKWAQFLEAIRKIKLRDPGDSDQRAQAISEIGALVTSIHGSDGYRNKVVTDWARLPHTPIVMRAQVNQMLAMWFRPGRWFCHDTTDYWVLSALSTQRGDLSFQEAFRNRKLRAMSIEQAISLIGSGKLVPLSQGESLAQIRRGIEMSSDR